MEAYCSFNAQCSVLARLNCCHITAHNGR